MVSGIIWKGLVKAEKDEKPLGSRYSEQMVALPDLLKFGCVRHPKFCHSLTWQTVLMFCCNRLQNLCVSIAQNWDDQQRKSAN